VPDTYLAAFANVAGLSLVTFDRALGKLAGQAALLLK
jgi:predicted nucleic acid-binding protein